jgi:hypothetical protein
MALFDKVKEQAEKAKLQAMDLKDKAEHKVEDVQANRKADDLLEDLGRVTYAERTGRPVEGADAEIERLIGELRQLEQAGVQILA